MLTLRHLLLTGVCASGLFLATGCAPDRPPDVPASAAMKTEGNKQLTYTADTDGMAYVTDKDTNTIVYSGRMLKGDTLEVDPGNNRVTLNGQTVYDKGLTNNDHRIFFLPTSR